MINNFSEKIKGDKIIWIVVSILAIFSFLPIYSASSNFGNGMILSNLLKHVSIVFVGFLIMFFTHMIPYKYFKGLSVIGIPIIIVVLVFTSMQGTIIEGANASRWLKLPLIGLSFQPSSLATVIILPRLEYSLDFFANNFGSILLDESSFSKTLCLSIISLTFCSGIIN